MTFSTICILFKIDFFKRYRERDKHQVILGWNKFVPSLKQSDCLTWKTNLFFQASVGLEPLGGYSMHMLTLLPGGNDSMFELGKKWVHLPHISLLSFTQSRWHKGLCGDRDLQQVQVLLLFPWTLELLL